MQVREKELEPPAFAAFARRVIACCRPFGALALVNGDEHLALELGADGVHLSSTRLLSLSAKPAGLVCAASCHNESELRHAEALGLDFVVLSPVQPTATHPTAAPLGWQQFGLLARACRLPVFALGGLTHASLADALKHGGAGIAMLRGAWCDGEDEKAELKANPPPLPPPERDTPPKRPHAPVETFRKDYKPSDYTVTGVHYSFYLL